MYEQKLNASKLGLVRRMLKKAVYALKLIIYTAATTELITMRKEGNEHVHLTRLTVITLYASSMVSKILNSAHLVIIIHSHILMTLSNSKPLKQTTYFEVRKLNTFQYGTYTYITNTQLILDASLDEKAVCLETQENNIEKDSWCIIVHEIEITYDDRKNVFIHDIHKLHCYPNDV